MSLEKMNLFGSVVHNDDNSDTWPDLPANASNQDVLDYMALIVARYLNCKKAFKDGYMLNQLLNDYSRMTHDIDFSIMNDEYYSQVKMILKRLGDYFIEIGIADSYKVKEEITSVSSGGMDVYRKSENGWSKIFGMDIGLHDILYGTMKYQISVGEVEGFEIERMLADKTFAILSGKRFRRTKDLYDFYVITNAFDVDLRKLSHYIEKRGDAEWENIPFSDSVLIEYEKAWRKLSLHSMAEEELEKPEFRAVLERFYGIALPLKQKHVNLRWDHEERRISGNL